MKYPNNINSKLPMVETTIFSIMSGLANEHGAINLSQGFPDFPTSRELKDLVYKHMNEGHNQYAPMQGVPALRQAIADKVFKSHKTRYNPDTEICITPGATYGIFTAIQALIHPEDEVIIFTPAYDCYGPAVEVCGGENVFIQLDPPDYKPNWQAVQKMINARTKMIIINTPHNPTGKLLEEDDLKALEHITRDSNIVVLSDEVYEHIIFDQFEHQSVCRYPKLAERSIAVYSFGKTFHNTGWKIGYCLAPENIMAEFLKVHQFNVYCVNTPIQYALAEYMQNPDHYNNLSSFYQQKRDFFVNGLAATSFDIIHCYGTYFQLVDYSNISDEADTDFAIRLTKEFGVATIPVSPFYNCSVSYKILRLCFAKTEDTMRRALERLEQVK